MASTMVALQSVTVGSGGAATVSFTSIPQTYTDLVIKHSARSTAIYAAVDVYITFNSVALGSQYRGNLVYGTGSATGAGGSTSTTWAGFINAGGSTTSTFGNNEITISNYAKSTFKSVMVDGISENNASEAYQEIVTNSWLNTAAITSLTLTPAYNLFAEFSTFTLYGVYNSALDTQVEAPTIGTAVGYTSTSASVAFTPSGTGAPATSFTATSSPGNITATASSSPIIVTGLTTGTAYTFTVKGQNPGGYGSSSAASNSVTPELGSYVALASASGAGTGSITFSNIPTTFKHLQIRGYMIGTGNNFSVRFNGDTGSNYSFHQIYNSNGSVGQSGAASQSFIYMQNGPTNGTNPTAFVMDITDYASPDKNKTAKAVGGYGYSAAGENYYRSGAWLNTSPIIEITLNYGNTFGSANLFELFGLEG